MRPGLRLPGAPAVCSCNQRQRNREIQARAVLRSVCRGEVDGDSASRERKSYRLNGRPNPLPGFTDRRVGQANHQKARQRAKDVHFYTDALSNDSTEKGRQDGDGHACLNLPGSCQSEALAITT